MSLIRVTRGVPKYNIQIGPIESAMGTNPTAILSVTDYFAWSVMQFPHFMWVPINEIGKPWGYMPFYAVKKILDFWCLDLTLPLVYVGCSAGKHRSPLMVFCWLLSQEGATPESVQKEFFGTFKKPVIEAYQSDLKNGYIPDDLPTFYRNMRQSPGATTYQSLLQQMLKYERVHYASSGDLLK